MLIGILGLVQMLLIALRATGRWKASWWRVLAPIWVLPVLLLAQTFLWMVLFPGS